MYGSMYVCMDVSMCVFSCTLSLCLSLSLSCFSLSLSLSLSFTFSLYIYLDIYSNIYWRCVYFAPTTMLPAVILCLILDIRCLFVFSVARPPPQQLQQQTTAAGAAASAAAAAAAAAAETHQPSTVLLEYSKKHAFQKQTFYIMSEAQQPIVDSSLGSLWARDGQKLSASHGAARSHKPF